MRFILSFHFFIVALLYTGAVGTLSASAHQINAPSTVGSVDASPTATKDEALPKIVEFHIVAGTGGKPWNEKAKPVVVRVGQTLRLFNDDSVPHQLHALGQPCEHGEEFGPGKTDDCVIIAPADPDKTELYDHHYGSSARFYVKATK